MQFPAQLPDSASKQSSQFTSTSNDSFAKRLLFQARQTNEMASRKSILSASYKDGSQESSSPMKRRQSINSFISMTRSSRRLLSKQQTLISGSSSIQKRFKMLRKKAQQIKKKTRRVPKQKLSHVQVQQAAGFSLRNEIFEDGKVKCPAFPFPLIDLEDSREQLQLMEQLQNQTENECDYDKNIHVFKAKHNWHKLFLFITDKSTAIPIKQMCLKAKHQDLIFNQIEKNWAKGKKIQSCLNKLKELNENMFFKGGPRDLRYQKKVLGTIHTQASFIEDKIPQIAVCEKDQEDDQMLLPPKLVSKKFSEMINNPLKLDPCTPHMAMLEGKQLRFTNILNRALTSNETRLQLKQEKVQSPKTQISPVLFESSATPKASKPSGTNRADSLETEEIKEEENSQSSPRSCSPVKKLIFSNQNQNSSKFSGQSPIFSFPSPMKQKDAKHFKLNVFHQLPTILEDPQEKSKTQGKEKESSQVLTEKLSSSKQSEWLEHNQSFVSKEQIEKLQLLGNSKGLITLDENQVQADSNKLEIKAKPNPLPLNQITIVEEDDGSSLKTSIESDDEGGFRNKEKQVMFSENPKQAQQFHMKPYLGIDKKGTFQKTITQVLNEIKNKKEITSESEDSEQSAVIEEEIKEMKKRKKTIKTVNQRVNKIVKQTLKPSKTLLTVIHKSRTNVRVSSLDLEKQISPSNSPSNIKISSRKVSQNRIDGSNTLLSSKMLTIRDEQLAKTSTNLVFPKQLETLKNKSESDPDEQLLQGGNVSDESDSVSSESVTDQLTKVFAFNQSKTRRASKIPLSQLDNNNNNNNSSSVCSTKRHQSKPISTLQTMRTIRARLQYLAKNQKSKYFSKMKKIDRMPTSFKNIQNKTLLQSFGFVIKQKTQKQKNKFDETSTMNAHSDSKHQQVQSISSQNAVVNQPKTKQSCSQVTTNSNEQNQSQGQKSWLNLKHKNLTIYKIDDIKEEELTPSEKGSKRRFKYSIKRRNSETPSMMEDRSKQKHISNNLVSFSDVEQYIPKEKQSELSINSLGEPKIKRSSLIDTSKIQYLKDLIIQGSENRNKEKQIEINESKCSSSINIVPRIQIMELQKSETILDSSKLEGQHRNQQEKQLGEEIRNELLNPDASSTIPNKQENKRKASSKNSKKALGYHMMLSKTKLSSSKLVSSQSPPRGKKKESNVDQGKKLGQHAKDFLSRLTATTSKELTFRSKCKPVPHSLPITPPNELATGILNQAAGVPSLGDIRKTMRIQQLNQPRIQIAKKVTPINFVGKETPMTIDQTTLPESSRIEINESKELQQSSTDQSQLNNTIVTNYDQVRGNQTKQGGEILEEKESNDFVSRIPVVIVRGRDKRMLHRAVKSAQVSPRLLKSTTTTATDQGQISSRMTSLQKMNKDMQVINLQDQEESTNYLDTIEQTTIGRKQDDIDRVQLKLSNSRKTSKTSQSLRQRREYLIKKQQNMLSNSLSRNAKILNEKNATMISNYLLDDLTMTSNSLPASPFRLMSEGKDHLKTMNPPVANFTFFPPSTSLQQRRRIKMEKNIDYTTQTFDCQNNSSKVNYLNLLNTKGEQGCELNDIICKQRPLAKSQQVSREKLSSVLKKQGSSATYQQATIKTIVRSKLNKIRLDHKAKGPILATDKEKITINL